MNRVKDIWRDAATLILAARTKLPSCNAGFDYRILMLRRSSKSSFMPNNYVFPGGVIDKADFSSEWLDLYQQSFPRLGIKAFSTLLEMKGPRPPVFQKSHNGVPSELALRICAIRETFEESGILLLKNVGENGLLSNKDPSNISEPELALQSWRNEVHNDASKFLVMCRELRCVPDVWSLGEWSNWLTPPDLKKQYDTAFFICFVDHEPSVQHDNTETTHSQWITPADAMVRYFARQFVLGPPQQYELLRFCRFPKWTDFKTFQEKRAMDGSEQLTPVRIQCSDGEVGVFPHDDMYASLFKKHVLEEMSQQTEKGPVPIPQYPETVAQMRSKTKNLHRVERVKGSGSSLLCNVALGHGQCTPLVDPSRIMALASDLKSGL